MLSEQEVLAAFPSPEEVVDNYLEWLDKAESGMIWISCAIDGEGDMSLIDREIISRGKYKCRAFQPRVRVSNTDKNFVDTARIICGDVGCISEVKRGGYKKCYILSLSANMLRRILPKIRLITKERRRLLLIEALDLLEERHGTGSTPRSKYATNRLAEISREIGRLNIEGEFHT